MCRTFIALRHNDIRRLIVAIVLPGNLQIRKISGRHLACAAGNIEYCIKALQIEEEPFFWL
jgi:hypothetical protein